MVLINFHGLSDLFGIALLIGPDYNASLFKIVPCSYTIHILSLFVYNIVCVCARWLNGLCCPFHWRLFFTEICLGELLI